MSTIHKCEKCNYETRDKSNFNKHLKSVAHLKVNPGITSKLTQKGNFQVPGKFQCPKCDKIFATAPSLSRHKNKICKIDELKEKVRDELKKEFEIEMMKQQLEHKNEIIETIKKDNKELKQDNNELKQYIQTAKPATTNNYNISIKKMIQQTYPDAPHLKRLEDYSIIHEDDDINLMQDLIYFHGKNKLNKYLGDIIIKYYKKEDPKDQALWSTDSSRLKYIIKELLASKNSHWNEDDKGLKINKCIIEPLLKYIHEYINDQIDKIDDDLQEATADECIPLSLKQLNLAFIREQIQNGTLKDAIIKYIAPSFRFNSDSLLTKLIKNE